MRVLHRADRTDVAPDGRFIMVKDNPTDSAQLPSLVVVLNWIEELKRLAPR